MLRSKNAGPWSGVFFVIFCGLTSCQAGLTLPTPQPRDLYFADDSTVDTQVDSAESGYATQELSRLLVVNETGQKLTRLFASLGSRSWGPDLLGTKGLAYGTMLGLFIHHRHDASPVDYLALDETGRVYLAEQVPVRQGGTNVLTLSVRNYKAHTRPPDLVTLYVSNATNRPFGYLFLAPESARDWGCDILGDSALLLPGASKLVVVPRPSEQESWEVLAASRDLGTVHFEFALGPETAELFLDIKPQGVPQ